MSSKSTSALAFSLLAGCAASGAPPPRAVPAAALSRNETVSVTAGPASFSEAPRPSVPHAALELPRDASFDVARQIGELRAAIGLYSQFLERAAGRPELEPAVQKARERIADAEQTIIFLQN